MKPPSRAFQSISLVCSCQAADAAQILGQVADVRQPLVPVARPRRRVEAELAPHAIEQLAGRGAVRAEQIIPGPLLRRQAVHRYE